MRLSQQQIRQFNVFGSMILRALFTPDEMRTLRAEYDYAIGRSAEIEPFDGTKAQTISMLGEDTPFYSSLPEDPRFYGPAEQLFGEDAFALEVNSYRYVGDTPWHYNDGAPNLHGYGAKYQFPLQSVRADSGALRFIPGSHKDPWQSELAGYAPLSRGSAGSEESMAVMDQIPCWVAECDPGDAILFDTRIFHGTYGGGVDRQVSCVTYYHYPETAEELEVMRNTAPNFYRSPTRWNKVQWEEWFSNPHGSPKRQKWLNAWRRLAETPQSETGLRLVYDEFGGATFEPVESR